MDDLINFSSGAVSLAYVVIALFFLRFYFRTGDRLFVMFAAALFLLASVRVTMIFLDEPSEHHYLYWIRFAGYLLILLAILDKNWPRRPAAS